MNERVEPLCNIDILCPKHAPKPDPRYRKMPMEHFVGKHCKLAFPAGPNKEHMWVHCTGLARHSNQRLGGLLENDPVFVDGVRRGDWIEFRRSQIEDVFSAEQDIPPRTEASP